MEKIKVTITGIRVFDDKDYPSVELHLAETIKGYAETKDSNRVITRAETDVDYISIRRAQLTRELSELNEDIQDYRGCRCAPFGQKQFYMMLKDAELTIIRTAHAAGEVRTDDDGNPIKDSDGNDCVFKNDCYTTNVVGVKLTEKAAKRIRNILANDD